MWHLKKRDMGLLLPSAQSLLLQMRSNGQNIASGTGFIANSHKGPVLITNRHNVTGQHNKTGKSLSPNGSIPEEIAILHNRIERQKGLLEWDYRIEQLKTNGVPIWIEHPILGARADFVALPLTQLKDVQLYPYTLGIGDPEILVAPSDTVSVIGFPFGLSGGGAFAIWATGFMATEPDVDYDGLPIFLIDCRARPGQSGSAVVAHRNGGSVAMENGGSAMYSGPVTKFLGIYSGRINDQSDLGIVWKASAIRELVDSIK
jgi:hypothetical protein